MKTGKLYLIPSSLAEESRYVPGSYELGVIHSLRLFLAERAKTARHYIASLNPPYRQQDIEVFELPKHGEDSVTNDFINRIRSGQDGGFLSEAGCPGIADPGADVVALAHEAGIQVVPLVGPSSILLALMASGFNGQSFCFKGYLPQDKTKLPQVLSALETEAARSGSTQIWIETPYRNDAMRDICLKTLKSETRFCIAAGLTGKDEWIFSARVRKWKSGQMPELHKTPAIFLLHVDTRRR